MEKAILAAASDIEKGESMSNAFAKSPLFPSMIIRMMSAGEQTGKVDAMLERIADFLDDEIETTLSGLTSLIEPLLIVFLGVTVGGIAICMFLPIFKMSEIINPSR
jgi:type IV pilus assembly protein PilC